MIQKFIIAEIGLSYVAGGFGYTSSYDDEDDTSLKNGYQTASNALLNLWQIGWGNFVQPPCY